MLFRLMEVFDEYKNIFAPISSQEVFTEILAAKEKAEQSFIARGLLQDAELQSLLVVRRVLSAMGFKHIAVGFAEYQLFLYLIFSDAVEPADF